MHVIKASAQAVLKRLGLNERLRASRVRDAYWWLTNNRLTHVRNREVLFYQNVLRGFRPGDWIFDVGANAGQKTEVFLELGARVLSVEPDEFNQEVLKEKFLKYRWIPRPVVIVGRAVSDRVGSETMWVDGAGSAANTFSEKWVDTLKGDKQRIEHTVATLEFAQRKDVETTTLEHLMGLHGRPFFVKIDVEGYELNALRGMKHSVPYLSFEANLPEFRSEALQCVALLQSLAGAGRFNYATDSEIGLALRDWLGASEFLAVLDACADKSIEVFWKTRACARN